MENQEIMKKIASLHNALTEISVRGEDAIRMSNALQYCRHIISELAPQESQKNE